MDVNIFNLNKKDKLYLCIIFIFSIGLIYFRTLYHMSGGLFFPDKALYLINALLYSGMDYYNIVDPSELYTPIIPFLTSILFRLGIVDQLAISLVSSFFAILGFIGLYILLRNRFDSTLSFTGVIFFGSISELLKNLSSGLLDLPAVAISILIILFGIIAINKNSKYFLIVLPLLVIGFFTRYTVGFMLPILFLYFVIKRNFIENIEKIFEKKLNLITGLKNYVKSEEFKFIMLSSVLSLTLFLIIAKFLIIDFGGSLTFIEQTHNTVNNVNYGARGIDVLYDKLFYLKNFSYFLFNESRRFDTTLACLVYVILFGGLSVKIINVIKNRDYLFKSDKQNKSKKFKIILLISLISCLVVSFISFKVFSRHLIANIFILISLAILFSLVNEFNFNDDNQALNILFVSYFCVYFIFMAIYSVKTLRYALPILPPLVYFFVLGLEGILSFTNKFLNKNIIPYLLILILVVSTFTFIMPMTIPQSNNDLVDGSNYVIDHDSDYHDKTFGSNYRDSRLIRWYLQDNVTFNDNYSMFDSTNITYIFSNSTLSLENYTEIFHQGYSHLYLRNDYL